MHKRSYIFLPLFILLVSLAGQFFSCESEDWIINVDCNECFGGRPDSADLIINVSINNENTSVPIEIYRGNSKGELLLQDTAYNSIFYFWAKMGEEYTVRASYRKGSQSILAFDSDDMVSRDFGQDCGDPCYIVKGGIFDLLLLNP